MINDGQVRKLRRLLASGEKLAVAARRSKMDEKTARKYRDCEGLPSERVASRTWRTRPDPFAEVWSEVQARLGPMGPMVTVYVSQIAKRFTLKMHLYIAIFALSISVFVRSVGAVF